MIELLATNNMVTISFVQSLLEDANIDYLTLDQNMSILEGSIGIIPRRIMVKKDMIHAAVNLLKDAGLEKEITTR